MKRHKDSYKILENTYKSKDDEKEQFVYLSGAVYGPGCRCKNMDNVKCGCSKCGCSKCGCSMGGCSKNVNYPGVN